MNKNIYATVAYGMSEMAATYPNDMISNALARVSRKLERYGTPFAEPLDDLDKDVIRFYNNQKAKK